MVGIVAAAAGDAEVVVRHVSRWISSLSALQAPSLQDLRAAFAGYPISCALPAGVARVATLLGAVAGTWFVPTTRDRTRRILYVHGGGFVCGDANMYAGLCGRLAQAASAALFFVDYRRAPEHSHPAALADVIAALGAVAERGPDEVSRPARLLLAGDSCGAGLALAAAIAVHGSGKRGPDAIACFSGWFDFVDLPPARSSDRVVTRTAMESAVAAYFAAQNPAAMSPLGQDLSGLPPLLVQAARDEALLPQSEALAQRARAAGVPVTLDILPHGHPHVCQFFWRELPAANAALMRAAQFLAGAD